MEAIQKENVDVHFTPVTSCTEKGVVGEDGVEREVDTIVCATGFDVSYKPRFPMVGKNGVDLKEKWKVCPESYLGLVSFHFTGNGNGFKAPCDADATPRPYLTSRIY